MSFEPLRWTTGADHIRRAELLVCLAFQNSIMGTETWTLAGYAPITVIYETPGEDALFEYAAKVDEMFLVWMDSLKDVPQIMDTEMGVDEVAEWRRVTWEETDELMKRSNNFTTFSRLRFKNLRAQQEVQDYKVLRTMSGFPILEKSIKDSIDAKLWGTIAPPVKELRDKISKRAKDLWDKLTETARSLDSKYVKVRLSDFHSDAVPLISKCQTIFKVQSRLVGRRHETSTESTRKGGTVE